MQLHEGFFTSLSSLYEIFFPIPSFFGSRINPWHTKSWNQTNSFSHFCQQIWFFSSFFPLKLQSFRLETYSSGIFLNEFWGSPPYPSEFVGDTLACWTELTLSLLGLGLLLMEDMTFPKNPWDAGSSAPSTGGATCTVGAPEIKGIFKVYFFFRSYYFAD